MRLLFALFLFLVMATGCAQQTKIRATVKPVSETTDPSSITLLRQQIAHRLQREGFKMSTVEPSEDASFLIIEAYLPAGNEQEKAKFRGLFQSYETELWETFRVTDAYLAPYLEKLPKVEGFTPHHQLTGDYHTPEVLGICQDENLRKSILDSLWQQWEVPEDLALLWTHAPTNANLAGESIFELVLINTRGQGKAPISNIHIERATVKPDHGTDGSLLDITMDETGTQRFFEMTTQAAQEMNRSIAIVLNGEITSLPRVQSPIEMGRCVISGAFDLEEAMTIATSIQYRPLIVPVQVEFMEVE
jgi:hypothetical protein